jgi:hypothetical protein
VTAHATSGDAIAALGERRCHAAVVHATEGAPARLPEAVAQTSIARWRVGIAAGVPADEIAGRLRDGRLTLVGQAATANAQVAVERWLRANDLGDVRRTGVARDHLEAARMASSCCPSRPTASTPSCGSTWRRRALPSRTLSRAAPSARGCMRCRATWPCSRSRRW